MRASVLRTIDLPGSWSLRSLSRAGTAVFGSPSHGVLRLAANGAVRIWSGFSACACSESGRVLARTQERGLGARLWVLSEDALHCVSIDLALDPLSMDGTWASESTLWCAGQLESGDLWIGEVALDGTVLCSTSITPADFEGNVWLVNLAAERAWLTFGNGQHGVWGHLVQRTRSPIVQPVPASWVVDGIVDASGDILAIEDGVLVRRDERMSVKAAFDPGPVRLDRLFDHPRALLAINQGTGEVFSLGRGGDRVESVLETASLFASGQFRASSSATLAAGSILATACASDGVTRVVFWTPTT